MLYDRYDHPQPEERYGNGEDGVDERLLASLVPRLKLDLRLSELFCWLFRHA
jgi:hypothetical protein